MLHVGETGNETKIIPMTLMSGLNNHRPKDINREAVRPNVLLTLFLGSLGVSGLIPLFYILTRRKKGDGRGWRFHEDRVRPLSRVDVGVKIRPVRKEGVICQICLGKMKAGLPRVNCDCGRVFHITCLKRTGFCPYCQRTYGPEQVEEMAIYPELESIRCPVCDRAVYKDSGSCECGAIIADEDGIFYCPSCGTQIMDGENECPYCHERFEDIRMVLCPFCGREFDERKGRCECGSFIGEYCPECGVRLSPEDRECPRCGAGFELADVK